MFFCRYDCEEIWRQFEEAVVRQSSCNVTVEDYHHMFYAMPQTWPCDTVSRRDVLSLKFPADCVGFINFYWMEDHLSSCFPSVLFSSSSGVKPGR